MTAAARRRGGVTRTGERATERLDVRLTTEERAELEAAASAVGEPLRAYVRDAALQRAREGSPGAPEVVPLDDAIEAATEALRSAARR